MAPTPLERAPSALAAGRDLWLKREDRHELGAFKWRGALPVLARFAAEGRAAVVTASTGNHGAATAWAGSRAGIAVQVFAPRGSSATKLARLERLGADVHIVGDDLDEAKDAAHAEAEGLAFFEDGAEPLQYEAYAEIAAELLDQSPNQPAAVVIPVGNGALAGGIGFPPGDRPHGRSPVCADIYNPCCFVVCRVARCVVSTSTARIGRAGRHECDQGVLARRGSPGKARTGTAKTVRRSFENTLSRKDALKLEAPAARSFGTSTCVTPNGLARVRNVPPSPR